MWKREGLEREIGKLDLGEKEMLNKGRKSYLMSRKCCRMRKVWDGKWQVSSRGRKRDQREGGATGTVDGCDNVGPGTGGKRADGLLFLFLYFLPTVSRFGCGLRASGSMRVSIAGRLSSISDNHREGVIGQWGGGEGWMQQKVRKRLMECNTHKPPSVKKG